ncbi:hypothetical protein GCM10011351_22960 [Paraliobacillus quinghaiensis]|uniref:Tetratricopeptide repeat protein n=1 Tax=Paraliobacillus quinghaiensis TaxID=470815 RepID=A0A917TUL6_9BACI|nr:tetratricopeptide repeat protein [Paraliobacillus quinghaiensis]GGM36286.1 hypothetical protein GCM10011351_22960 [Paraliobacillus quinghaiensis]
MITLDEVNEKNETNNNVLPFVPEGDFYFSKGVDAFYKRKFDIALKWLKKAKEADPDEPLYPCQMSIIYTEIGAYHAANKILTEIIETHGDDYLDCYYLISNNFAHLGLLQDAEKYATLYLKKAPDGEFKEETESLLTVLELSKDEEDDEDWFTEDEDELVMYQETAFYHLERQEWEQAIPLLQEMMTLFPDHITAKHEYNYALFFSGNQQEAIELEEKWLEKDQQSIFSRTNLILFYNELQEFEKVDILLKSIANIYPIHEQQKLRIATTLAHIKHYKTAYARFSLLAKSKLKGHISYFKYYSTTAFQVGDMQRAKKIWHEGCKQHTVLQQEIAPWELD